MDAIWIGVATFAFNVAIVLVGGGIAYARQEGRMKDMVVKAQQEIDAAIHLQAVASTQAQREASESIKTAIREFGETATAIRQKITEVELFMRDNYIKRDSFYHGISELAANVKNLGDSLDGRLIRMEFKIDAGRKPQRESDGT